TPPKLPLSNRFTILGNDYADAGDGLGPSLTTPVRLPGGAKCSPTIVNGTDNPAAVSFTGACARKRTPVAAQTRRSARGEAASTNRRIKLFQDAVTERCIGHDPPQSGQPCNRPTATRAALRSAEERDGSAPAESHSLPPRPLFTPTALIIGDSITRNIRYINAVTRCFPGATVMDILQKLPDLLLSLPSTIIRIIVHVGTNDTTLQQSEVTKRNFLDLFHFLKNTGKTVFISGPIPTISRGSTRFSRILSLNTWLQSASRKFSFGFIDNFNLFWNCPSFYRPDGLHPSSLGTNILTANIQHTVHCFKDD
uniref:SGNH hydrolase-type esterase domain-containing protein n=1 Tax=Oryzias latipes TaxID=8090 RepID=A0A3P9IFD8_ORYLA